MGPDIVAKNSILDADAARRRIRRMAYEVAEQNTGETGIVILGIEGNGEVVAGQLRQELSSIFTVPVSTGIVRINKKAPLDARIDGATGIDGKVILVVDDVSNTGKTLLYALKPLLSFQPKKIQTLVLVERSHKLFAVQPDFVGLSVSTTLQEHITVETDGTIVTGAFLH
ncbi:phosphoribosyltransferase [Flaviaesturariibacter flavus]|uniref:Phosphoribosyltransferase n=1 Tax=Flaviaesturariibacter flavus TaxID=2502780 RepID=A0A4R1BNU1_9BACT|nr:phosphoribosyltransferase family protein [Flaviaesturariibacter flavus]TCJ19263.1 phosphoribosyltransferase [Flaviaesturariibacter flavus]